MIFTTPFFLLAGLVAAAIPIAIHLLSKGKPKRVVFPALRFAQAKLATNKRKLTLKRLALLAIRVGLCLLLGLALARPFFAPSVRPVVSDAEAESGDAVGIEQTSDAVAAAIVVDSSIRMGRVKNNRELFETARDAARAIVEQLPKGSEIAILSGDDSGDAFQPDRIAARERLDKLTIQPDGRTVAETTLEALALLKRSQLVDKETFVLTDATRAGWSERDLKRIRKEYAESADNAASIYFVDLGDNAYRDAAIVDLALSAETIATGSPLRIDVDVERVGETEVDAAIELVLFDAAKLPKDLRDATLFSNSDAIVRRETQTVSFGPGRVKKSLNFQTSGLPVGSCVGAVRIVGGDALAADDARWFAVDVVPEWRLLVVAPQPVATKSLYLTQALAPQELRKTGRAPFELDVVPYALDAKNAGTRESRDAPSDLQSAKQSDLERYRAVLLLDPPGLAAADVAKLTSFVESGGGLGVFLGRSASPKSFQTPECARLIGAKPIKRATTNWDVEIRPLDYDAPALAPFRQFERAGIPWDAAPVAQYWRLADLAESASVVAEFRKIGAENADSSDAEAPPALVENRLGRGIVATLATPISDGAQEKPWNELTSGDAVWIFVVLADGVARRLASSSSSILNYSLGEIATLRSPLKTFPAVATLTTPSGEEIATPTDVERRQTRVPGAKELGLYRLATTPNQDGESIATAFAVSAPAELFDLSRYSDEDWKRLWDGIPLKALDLQAASAELDAARRGKESEPYATLIVALALLFVVETGVANRFYKK